MRNFITLLSIIFIITACDGKYVHMKQMLYMTVDDVVQTADFKVYDETKFSDEVESQLKKHKYNLNWDRSFYEVFANDLNNPTIPDDVKQDSYNKAQFYKQEILNEMDTITYLENLGKIDTKIFNDVVYTTYKMSYMYVKPNGDKDMDLCFGRFDNKGKMILFKPSSKSKWMVLEKPVYE